MDNATDAKKSKHVMLWVFLAFFVLGILRSHHSPTAKDLVLRASGQQAVPSDETPNEQQARVLLAQIIAVHKQMDDLDAFFMKSLDSQHIMTPETFSSPTVAAEYLSKITGYCDSTLALGRKSREAQKQLDQLGKTTEDTTWIDNQFNGVKEWCSTAESLYSFASDPKQRTQVLKGQVYVADPDSYNERIHAVNTATKKMLVANAVYEERQKQLGIGLGLKKSDYGYAEDK